MTRKTRPRDETHMVMARFVRVPRSVFRGWGSTCMQRRGPDGGLGGDVSRESGGYSERPKKSARIQAQTEKRGAAAATAMMPLQYRRATPLVLLLLLLLSLPPFAYTAAPKHRFYSCCIFSVHSL